MMIGISALPRPRPMPTKLMLVRWRVQSNSTRGLRPRSHVVLPEPQRWHHRGVLEAKNADKIKEYFKLRDQRSETGQEYLTDPIRPGPWGDKRVRRLEEWQVGGIQKAVGSLDRRGDLMSGQRAGQLNRKKERRTPKHSAMWPLCGGPECG